MHICFRAKSTDGRTVTQFHTFALSHADVIMKGLVINDTTLALKLEDLFNSRRRSNPMSPSSRTSGLGAHAFHSFQSFSKHAIDPMTHGSIAKWVSASGTARSFQTFQLRSTELGYGIVSIPILAQPTRPHRPRIHRYCHTNRCKTEIKALHQGQGTTSSGRYVSLDSFGLLWAVSCFLQLNVSGFNERQLSTWCALSRWGVPN